MGAGPATSRDGGEVLRLRFRREVGLPLVRPAAADGLKCGLCVNECSVPRVEGAAGYCGVWVCRGGRLEPLAGRGKGLVEWYLDPHPTNCVASHFCPAVTGAGYPKYAVREGLEEGYYNLAVFLTACNLDCLYCQNWHHKVMAGEALRKGGRVPWVRSVEELVNAAMSPKVTCVCFFGGDPGPQAPYVLAASRRIVERARVKGLVKRICWETNGLEHPGVMEAMARLSLVSGGIVKVDWKAWDPVIYGVLTGVDGVKALKRLKENVKVVAQLGKRRPEVPLLTVSVLLVPNYVGPEDVRGIAEYVASLDPNAPLVLLAFHPDHLMTDVPPTPASLARECVAEARRAGVRRVYVGNVWLLT